MRTFAVILALALTLPAVAAARLGDKGDSTVVVKNARGQMILTATGSAIGRVDAGTIVVQDTSASFGDDIQVLNYDPPAKVDKLTGATTYVGTKMRFRVIGSGYIVTVTGKGINVTAVGKGYVQGADLRDGQVSLAGGPFKALLGGPAPYVVSFGQQ